MAVIEYDSYKQKLLAMDETFENLFKALEIEQARQELNRLELEAHEDGFWNDLERSQKNQMRSKQLQNKIHRYEKLVSTRDDLLALIDMGKEMDDASLLPELEEGYSKLEADVEQARLTTLLSFIYFSLYYKRGKRKFQSSALMFLPKKLAVFSCKLPYQHLHFCHFPLIIK